MKVESPRLASSITESNAADSVVKIAMVFRVWTSAPADAEDTQAINASRRRSGVLALIEDAAASMRGVVVTGDDHGSVSGLRKPTDALVLSRQIQHGMRGLRGLNNAAPVALSVAIDFGGRSAPAVTTKANGEENLQKPIRLPGEMANETQEISHDLVSLLALSRPAQILITHDLLQQIAAIKGLPLRSFPGRFGVYEYLWTRENELELLQSEPHLTLAAVPPPVPAVVSEEPRVEITGTTVATTARSEYLRKWGRALQPLADLTPHPSLWLGVLAAVIIVALALVGFGVFHSHSSAPANVASPGLAAPHSPVAGTSQGPQPENPSGAIAAATSKRKMPSASSPRGKHGRPSEAATPANAPAGTSPDTAATPQQSCTLPGDINKYASLAESDRERGDYANAVRIFRQVLNCDPNNAAARTGLNRALQAQEQSR